MFIKLQWDVLVYNHLMKANMHPPIVQLISDFQNLQCTARTMVDIETAIKAKPLLLKEVCLALGRNDFSYEGARPSVRCFTLDAAPTLSHTFKDRSFLDKYMHQYQMFSKVRYNTDIMIDLRFIFSNVPELGLAFDNETSDSYKNGAHQQRLFFSPGKWPIIAAHFIQKVYTSERLKRDAADALLDDFYPGINRSELTNILGSGIFEHAGEFCDWLMANTTPATTKQFDTTILNDLDL